MRCKYVGGELPLSLLGNIPNLWATTRSYKLSRILSASDNILSANLNDRLQTYQLSMLLYTTGTFMEFTWFNSPHNLFLIGKDLAGLNWISSQWMPLLLWWARFPETIFYSVFNWLISAASFLVFVWLPPPEDHPQDLL